MTLPSPEEIRAEDAYRRERLTGLTRGPVLFAAGRVTRFRMQLRTVLAIPASLGSKVIRSSRNGRSWWAELKLR